MKPFIEIERIKKEVPFVNLVLTTKEVDAKNKSHLENSTLNKMFTLDNLTSNIQIHEECGKEATAFKRVEELALFFDLF